MRTRTEMSPAAVAAVGAVAAIEAVTAIGAVTLIGAMLVIGGLAMFCAAARGQAIAPGGAATTAPAVQASPDLPPPPPPMQPNPPMQPIPQSQPSPTLTLSPSASEATAPAQLQPESPETQPPFPETQPGFAQTQPQPPETQPATFGQPASSPTTAPSFAQPPLTLTPTYTATQPAPSGTLGNLLVTSYLDQQRVQIAPSLGAVSYTIGPSQINVIPGGENTPFQQVMLRAPGVVIDSFGQFHVRGEHANTTYDINGVLLPQPINGFGQEVDTHLVQSVTLIDGTLPAQYGFHTAGIIDITTKSGASLDANQISIYGGGYNTYQPSFSFGGSQGQFDYFVTGSYRSDSNGIENPTDSFRPIHDDTEQTHGFAYLAYRPDDTSRISLILNGYYGNFQIPNTPNLPQNFTLAGVPVYPSQDVNENQNEQEYYSVLSYQTTIDNFSTQLSAFSRYGLLNFQPDPVGDLIYLGAAGGIHNSIINNGIQSDSSDILNDQHTVRFGGIVNCALERQDTSTAVFAVDPATGNQASDAPFTIPDDSKNTGLESGVYVQDEWTINSWLTFNYGGRYDRFDASFTSASQFSPRANLVFNLDKQTTAHVGYARYFVPPPVQQVSSATLEKFINTTNAPDVFLDEAPKVERSNYFDAGISRQITKPWTVNIDGYYKAARNLVDLGQFGVAPILAPFNYKTGTVYGAELSTTYRDGPFSFYGNFAYVETHATDINSQQFEFDAATLDYIDTHYVHLDHESEFTGSSGISYDITQDDLVYVDMTYGSGLRGGFANTLEEPEYYPINVGYQHTFHPSDKDSIVLRADVTNLFDESYQLRDGNGIGTFAPQYGARRAFYLGLSYNF